MVRSMTAYARKKSKELEGIFWTVELHSVNRKMLDINMQLGKELLFLDMEFRKILTKEIYRGQVTVKISYSKHPKSKASLSFLKKLQQQFLHIAKELQLSSKEITLPFLLLQFDRFSVEEGFGGNIELELKKTLQHVLKEFIKIKEVEGKTLGEDIKAKLKLLSKNIALIEKENKKNPEKYRKKLQKHLAQIFSEAAIDERILKEVAIFAEKIDITEEITRLKSHIQQTESLLQSTEKSVGKTFEFFAQEMLREINTIASKSGSLAVTKIAISSKAEIEKIREQSQNIE